MIVAISIPNAERAAALASILIESYNTDGQQIGMGASLGLAVAPDHGIDPDDLIKSADSTTS